MSTLNITPDTTIALVTGSNQGIGFEIAKKLASENKDCHVIVSGRRADAVKEATSSLETQGLNVSSLVLDITSGDSIAAAVKTINEEFGRLDILINNSAISGHGMTVSRRELMIAVYNTNCIGTALVTDALIPLLERSTKTRRIVFVSSALSSLTLKADPADPMHSFDLGVYTHSKSALNMMALHYAVRYEDDLQWKVNITCPGHNSRTVLNGYTGTEPVDLGAISSFNAAILGSDGETGTFKDDKRFIPW
ncbi:carbonyl reductase 1 [Fusarium beomiforme]|uniref:Carbonyl reductase 1 n=1 Tax=Fusarium beomiforme TaxID=44412 RepID=A0A9P5A5P2_9HYPO|nr:carbonyl reductase 1 [Fusarium beomiforme]